MPSKTIADKAGNVYPLLFVDESEERLHIMVQNHEQWVGEVKCHFLPPDTMELCDIRMLDEVVPYGRFLKRLIPFRLRRRWWSQNYQRRGLGTALLEFTLNYARQRGMQHVVGSVVYGDLGKDFPLLDWYQSFGFIVIPEENAGPIAARIYLAL